MASSGLLGFIKGASGTALDTIRAREEDERAVKKAEFLAKLQAETQRELEDYREQLAAARPDDKMSGADYGRGKFVVRDRAGGMLSERDLTSDEMESYKLGREKERLGLDATRANIRQSNAAARASDANAEYTRSGKGGKGGRSLDKVDEAPDDFDRANELLYRYKTEVDAAREAARLSPLQVRQAAVAIMQNSRTGDQAQQEFLTWLGRQQRMAAAKKRK